MILAGDIGGTKTSLALFDWKTERVEPVREQTFASADYKSLEEIVEEFLLPPAPPEHDSDDAGETAPEPEKPPRIDAACFGIAGPVIENASKTTNLPWVVDGAALSKQFAIPHVRLLNDLEATGYGLLVLKPDETEVLNAGTPPRTKGAMALIAAGTGLGEAILFWDGSRYHPTPSEGGHCSFAPTSDLEMELLRYLRAQHTHVSFERVLSGMGLQALYEFLRDTRKNEPTWLAEKIKVGDPPAIIAEAGLKKQAEIAVQALDMMATIYGAEAGNLALKALALDGVYLGGGIAPKLLAKLKEGLFMKAFIDKGRYKKLLAAVPVRVIMNPKAALLGAASVAAQLRKGAP
ncbi:MAG: glucokinase [Nitrospirae bacterium RIFCSPLOWO2_02_FULL_62_14]|nr:MAG: glucokinase [Nitrospirae bacterium RIFCSPLOWO2_01_FULL_62_17]OGW66857.1 MAG: glucokinase [Nitrospirae bacterium RIFCSPLOWO2_02_FULL_62_14]OGW87957.1 MAG: glucokinase [Nitrospirae bacterium RIFCSPLOWO2_12_FULL_63_8]